jgi:hypothetical protein
VSDDTWALFNASVPISIGAGTPVKFWVDAWIDVIDVESISPVLIKLVRSSARRARTVANGLNAHSWASDISGELTVDVLGEYLMLWNAIQHGPRLGPRVHDAFRWKWTPTGQFSAGSERLRTDQV